MKSFKTNKLKKLITALCIVILVTLIVLSIIEIPSKAITSQVYTMEYTGQFIDIGNIKSFYIDTLNVSDPVILLVHGFGGSVYSWRENIKSLYEAGFRVLAIDLKGFGLSSKAYNEDYSHKSQAEYLYKFLQQIGVKKVNIVGHSMGANIATIFAMEYPNNVQSLVIVDGAIVQEDATTLPFLFDIKPIRNIFKLTVQNVLNKENFSEFLKSAYVNQSVISNSVIDNYYIPLQTNNWEDALMGISRDGYKNKIPKSFESLKIPVLIVWGKNDPWINIEKGINLNQEIINSKFIVIDGSGHLPMEEKPKEFNQTLLDFLGII